MEALPPITDKTIVSKFALKGQTPRDVQLEGIRRVYEAFQAGSKYVVLEGPPGCHAKGQKVLMYDGALRAVEDVQKGDAVMGMGGFERRVVGLCQGRGPLVEVQPVKGDPFVVTLDHTLTLVRSNTHTRGEKVRRDCRDGEVVDVTVRDWLMWSTSRKHHYKLFRERIRLSGAFEQDVASFRVSPYFLGLLLGDGAITSGVQVCKLDPEIEAEVKHQAEVYGLRAVRTDSGWQLSGERSKQNPVTASLRELGLWGATCGTKFVPAVYKAGTPDVRRAVLAGLLDTDGHLTQNCFDYISKSQQLAEDVTYLARSLGLAAYLKPVEKYCQTGGGGQYYRVSISGELSQLPIHLARKRPSEREQKKDVLRTGFTVLGLGEGDYYGITLDSGGRYLMGDFTVTHNCGKSGIAMTLARMMGLSYFCTLTKQLQTQYLGDFKHLELAELKGRGAFPCKPARGTCADGATLFKGKHACKVDACPYQRAKREAFAAPYMVANYHSFLANVREGARYRAEGGALASGMDLEELDEAALEGGTSVRPFLVLDECFPAGTRVSGHHIEDIRPGWVIPSWDEAEGRVVPRRVVNLFKKKPTGLLRVVVRDRVVVCTPNHPFLTPEGWIPAVELSGRRVLYTGGNESSSIHGSMLGVREEVQSRGGAADEHASAPQAWASGVLRPSVLAYPPKDNNADLCMVREDVRGHGEASAESSTVQPDVLLEEVSMGRDGSVRSKVGASLRKAILSADEEAQSDVRPQGEGSGDDRSSPPGGLVPQGAWGERKGTDGSRDAALRCPRLASGGSHSNLPSSEGLPNQLQTGRGEFGTQGGNRGGRPEPLQPQGAGREEGNVPTWVRVDRVEVLEPGRDGTFGGVCSDGYVYNLEVEGTHTYLVDGLVVHNCHSVENFLMEAVAVTIRLSRFSFVPQDLPKKGSPTAAYVGWLKELMPQLKQAYAEAADPKVKEDIERLARNISFAIVNHNADEATREEWIVEHFENDSGFKMMPLTVRRFGNWVWRYGERVLLMSATVLDASTLVSSLGLDPNDGDFVQLPCIFPKENRPVIAHSLDMTFDARDESWPIMVEAVKGIFEHHAKQKGLLLVPSNAMLKYIHERLPRAMAQRLIVAAGEDRLQKYHEHMISKTPTILAASGFWEGADLKDDSSRFQVIPQLPRPQWSGQVKARTTQTKEGNAWYRWRTWTRLIQGLGRSVRTEKDSAVSYVLDRDFKAELMRAGSLIPPWLREAVIIPPAREG